jgi:hypothetical protein
VLIVSTNCFHGGCLWGNREKENRAASEGCDIDRLIPFAKNH